MNYAISNRKWYYLGIGVFGPVFLFLPIARLDGLNQYIFGYNEFIGTSLGIAVIYMLIIVPFNAIYHRVYNQNYFDMILKIMAAVIPILAVIALIMLVFTNQGQTGEFHYTIYFYLLIIYLCIAHGLNLYVSFKEAM